MVGKNPTCSPGCSARLLRHMRYSAMLSIVRIPALSVLPRALSAAPVFCVNSELGARAKPRGKERHGRTRYSELGRCCVRRVCAHRASVCTGGQTPGRLAAARGAPGSRPAPTRVPSSVRFRRLPAPPRARRGAAGKAQAGAPHHAPPPCWHACSVCLRLRGATASAPVRPATRRHAREPTACTQIAECTLRSRGRSCRRAGVERAFADGGRSQLPGGFDWRAAGCAAAGESSCARNAQPQQSGARVSL